MVANSFGTVYNGCGWRECMALSADTLSERQYVWVVGVQRGADSVLPAMARSRATQPSVPIPDGRQGDSPPAAPPLVATANRLSA